MSKLSEQTITEMTEMVEDSRPLPRKGFVDELEAQLFDEPATTTDNTISWLSLPARGIWRYGAAAVAMLLMTVTVFAAGSLLYGVLERDSGLATVERTGSGVTLDASQTKEGITVEIPWAYADRNRITIAVVFSSDGLPDASLYRDVLLNSDGNEFETRFGGYSAVNQPTSDDSAKQVVYYTSYDVSQLDTLPDTFNVTFQTQAYRETPDNGTIPFEFDLEIPVAPASVTLTPQQTVQDNGITMTLESVSIAPSGVIANICYDTPETPANETREWGAFAYLYVGDDDYFGQDSNADIPNCTQKLFSETLINRAGTWTLTMTNFSGRRTDVDLQSDSIREEAEALGATYDPDGSMHFPGGVLEELGFAQTIDGEWSFTFDVPAIEPRQ